MRLLVVRAVVVVLGAVLMHLRRGEPVIPFRQTRRYARTVAERKRGHWADNAHGINGNQRGCCPSPHSFREPRQHWAQFNT